MMRNRAHSGWARTALLLAALGLAGCETPLSERILSIETDGHVLVFIFRDDDLNGAFNAGPDKAAANAAYALRMVGGTQDVPVRTDTAGFNIAGVRPGRYTLSVAGTVLGDSLEVVAGASEFTIAASDTIRRNVALAYKTLGATAARTAPQGRRFWLLGVALNAPGTFGDSTLNVKDATMAIRAFAVQPANIVAGDTVLFLGRAGSLDGQPAFEVISQFVRGRRVPVLPDSVSTATAASARAGALDARLVRVFNAVIADTATDPLGNRLLTVNDGSGPLRLLLTRFQNWAPVGQLAVGARLQATGLLAPDPARPSVWVMKPRLRSDLLVF
jgi:hypothetical protein